MLKLDVLTRPDEHVGNHLPRLARINHVVNYGHLGSFVGVRSRVHLR